MESRKDLPKTNAVSFLEHEVKRLEEELLQKVREIEVETALEKVRTKAMSMQSSSELSDTSILLFQQLKELKIEAIRSGLGIFDDEENAIELWLTSLTDDGKLFFILDYVNAYIHPVFENIITCREQKKPFAFTKLEGAELVKYYRIMSTYIGPRKIGTAEIEYYYAFFFSAGTFNVVTAKELSAEEISILLRMANVFGLIYTRFQDLKTTEDQALQIREEKLILEKTLADLRATQSQLIQSEKMASLGELTAGVAHEIQNPLNFVNNFSEVNKELIMEMRDEIEKKNFEKATAIAKDIEENEVKIIHHGKRADAIVKSMLQHSSISAGKKELTDINVLCEEYVRLAYHGLRAGLNVKFEKDFDPEIIKINVVPQEIGRAMINIINNALYAVTNQQKQNDDNYEPTIILKTSKIPSSGGGGAEISVIDNGHGIPEAIRDKIFQPFFTTKPTGQGTGLGLSLVYDIITKGHGGELKVHSVEGEGSEFIISLPASK